MCRREQFQPLGSAGTPEHVAAARSHTGAALALVAARR